MKLRLLTRIGIDFWVAIATAALVALVALGAFEAIRRQADLVRKNLTPSVTLTSDMMLSIEQMEVAETRYFPEAPDNSRAAQEFDQAAARFERDILGLPAQAFTPREQILLQTIERTYREYLMADSRMRELIATGRINEARILNATRSLETSHQIREAIRTFREINFDEIEAAEALAERYLVLAEVAMGVVGLMGVLIGTLLWRKSSRTLVEPLLALREAARSIADGKDVRAWHPEAPKTVEIDALLTDFNRMASQLQAFTADLRTANATLEARVDARTQELQAAKSKLEAMVEELQGVDRLKSNLLAIMSHELLTPINFITGFGSALEDDLLGPLSPEQRHAIRRIMEGADRLTRMVRNVLDFSKLGAGELTILPEELDYYGQLVRETAENARPAAEAKHQTLEVLIPPDLPSVWADPARVQQLLSELLDNAVKFTGEGGRITLRLSSTPDWIATEVTDTGVGIPSESIPSLSKPFFQVDLSSTRAYGGLGLGLAIANHLITKMGGFMMIDSQLGRGSTFRVMLPRADRRAALPPASELAPPQRLPEA